MKKESSAIDVNEITGLELAVYPRSPETEQNAYAPLEGSLIITSGKKIQRFSVGSYSRIPAACTAVVRLRGEMTSEFEKPIKTKFNGVRILLDQNGSLTSVIQDIDYEMPQEVKERLADYPEYGLAGFVGCSLAGLGASIDFHGDRVMHAEELKNIRIITHN